MVLGAAAAGAQTWTFVPNLVYGTYAGTGGAPQNLFLDLYLPLTGAQPYPVAIWIHGGGWSGGSRFPVPGNVTALCARGYAVASIEYRLTGTAPWPAQIHDCKGAIRWLRASAATYGLDRDRFAVWGSSAGGHLVAFLGAAGGVGPTTIGSLAIDLEGSIGGNTDQSSRVQAVVDWFGPTDFLAMRDFPTFDHESVNSPESHLLGAAIQTVPERVASADPITFLSPDDPPFLIMHGTDDTTVPFNQSELLHRAALREAGIEATLFPVLDTGHGGPGFNAPAAVALVNSFLDNWLLNAPAARVSVTAAAAGVPEAGGVATFVVSRSGPTGSALTVPLSWSGSAAPGLDHAPPPLFAVIAAGAANAAVTVPILDDALVEGPETLSLTVAASRDYRIDVTAQTATVAIADDESATGLPQVAVTALDPAATEAPGDAGIFRITRTGPLAAPLTVRYRVGGRATNGADFQALSGILTIPAGSPGANVNVLPVNDQQIEPSETVILTLQASAAHALGTSTSASLRIADDDAVAARPTVSIISRDHDAGEPANAGAFMVTRTLGTAQPLLVNLSQTGTAIGGIDVAALPATVTIPAGAAWATVPLGVLDDLAAEGEESVVLTIAPAPTYQRASAPAQEIWIADDDLPATAAGLALRATPLALGSTGSLSVAAPAGLATFGVVAASGPGYLPVPGLGSALIDPASLLLLGTGALDASGVGTLIVAIPDVPQVRGFPIWLQAYALDPSGSSGTVSPAIVREFVVRGD